MREGNFQQLSKNRQGISGVGEKSLNRLRKVFRCIILACSAPGLDSGVQNPG